MSHTPHLEPPTPPEQVLWCCYYFHLYFETQRGFHESGMELRFELRQPDSEGYTNFFLCLYKIYDHIFSFSLFFYKNFFFFFLQKHFMTLSWSKSSSGFPLHLKSSFSFLTRLTSCFTCSISAYSPVFSYVRLPSPHCTRAALILYKCLEQTFFFLP